MDSHETAIERHLRDALTSHLGPDAPFRSQYMIDYYDIPVTIPDFAFPDARIAIYCDGYQWHKDRERFYEDRYQSRELQLRGWLVLRFTGSEILNNTDAVMQTIEKAVKRKARERANQQKRLWVELVMRRALPIGGAFAAGLVAAVVLMILIEWAAPVFFYHLTVGL